MISKNQIKLIRSLHQKKFRDEHNLFIAEGEKVVRELMDSGLNVKYIFATKEFAADKPGFPFDKINCEIVTEEELSKISALTTAQGILAVAEIPFPSNNTQNSALTLVLDDIKDPGNLGTIIRIADWFGINEIICSETSADAYNPKVVQAAMGSLFRVNVKYLNLISFLKEKTTNKLVIYGTLLEGENIYEAKLTNEGFIVIGNESKGISKELLPLITHKISIPTFSSKKTDSLNAAMAAAIVCSEFKRRLH